MEPSSPDQVSSCVFCRILRAELTPQVLAFRDAHTAVFPSLRQRPRNLGHMLVVPIRHVPDIYQLGDDLADALMTTLARVAAAVKTAFSADGISIRQNNDPAGDQDVFHLHFHVIPRFANDGFTTGDDRYPLSAVEVPLEQRIEQARQLSQAIDQLRNP